MATLLAVQVRECEGCQAPNNSASTAHSSNWYRLILFSIITYYSTIQLFPPGPDKAPLWEWLERWRPGPIQWPWPHQWIRYHLNHLMVTVVKSMEIGPKYGALLIEIYRPVVQVSRSLRLRRQLQKWKGMSGCWARRCIPAPLGGKASMQHATGTQDPNEMSMSTRLDCIETYWNILKHIETYWKILKHIETYWNILKHIETYWNIKSTNCGPMHLELGHVRLQRSIFWEVWIAGNKTSSRIRHLGRLSRSGSGPAVLVLSSRVLHTLLTPNCWGNCLEIPWNPHRVLGQSLVGQLHDTLRPWIQYTHKYAESGQGLQEKKFKGPQHQQGV